MSLENLDGNEKVCYNTFCSIPFWLLGECKMARYFKCVLNKPALSYNCGETIRFEVFARDRCRNVECKYIRWELKTDDGEELKGLGSCGVDKPLVIETKLERPGFVRLICKAVNEKNVADGGYEPLDAGAGAEVERIEYHDTLPEDFCDYWKCIEKLVADTEPEVLMCEEISGAQKGFKAYDMRIKTPEGRPASFVLTIPETDGKYPVKAIYMSYGVHPAFPIYNEGYITAYFNAHGIENCVPQIEVIEKYKSELVEGYGFEDDKNKSNMTIYWRGVMIRDLMGAKYLKTLENWDGENLVISGGSQGAFQATTVAAHTEGATYLEIGIPWFCDLRGIEKGYMRGWRPNFSEALRYFDTAAQGKFVKCPVKITAGLGDYVCPPSGVMALYNGIKTLKSITFTQAATHGYAPNERDCYTLESDPENPTGELKKGRYRHFKGKEYEVLDVALNCETLEETVVYKALYGEGRVWIRPKSDFIGFVYRDNKILKRFQYIG